MARMTPEKLESRIRDRAYYLWLKYHEDPIYAAAGMSEVDYWTRACEIEQHLAVSRSNVSRRGAATKLARRLWC